VLACAVGFGNSDVADRVEVNVATLRKWRKRFATDRLDGLQDEPRPGVPRMLGDDDVEALVVKTLTETPKDATNYSTRDMAKAKATGMSQPTIARMWKAFGLKPWTTDTFKLSKDPLFIEKVPDVVGIYMNPPEPAVVCCVDEKTASRLSTGCSPSFQCAPAKWSAGLMTTCATGSRISSPR